VKSSALSTLRSYLNLTGSDKGLLQVHGTAPIWLHDHIVTTAPENAVPEKREVVFKMTDIRTGKATFAELQPALDARQRIVQIKQVCLTKKSQFCAVLTVCCCTCISVC